MKDLIRKVLLEFDNDVHTISREENRFTLPTKIDVVLTFDRNNIDEDFLNRIYQCSEFDVDFDSGFIKIGTMDFNSSVRQVIKDRIQYLYNDFLRVKPDPVKEYWIYLQQLMKPNRLQNFIDPNGHSCKSRFYNEIKERIHKGKLVWEYNLKAPKIDNKGNHIGGTDNSVGSFVVALVINNKVKTLMLRTVNQESLIKQKNRKEAIVLLLNNIRNSVVGYDPNSIPAPPHMDNYNLSVETIKPVDIKQRRAEIDAQFSDENDPRKKLEAMELKLGEMKQKTDENDAELKILRNSLLQQQSNGETNTQKYFGEVTRYKEIVDKKERLNQIYTQKYRHYQNLLNQKPTETKNTGHYEIVASIMSKRQEIKQMDKEIENFRNSLLSSKEHFNVSRQREPGLSDITWQNNWLERYKNKESELRDMISRRNKMEGYVSRLLNSITKQ